MSETGRPARGFIDPNFPNPHGPNDAEIIIYGYTPSLALGLLGVILFSLSAALHGYQLIRYRTWYFSTVFVGTLMEIVGYIARILANRKSPYNIIFFIIQYFFIVTAPVLFSAAIYTLLSVLIHSLSLSHPSHHYTPLSPRLILFVFIAADVIATGTQVAGAALIGKAESDRKDSSTANNILLGGLAFQCFTFLVFIVLLSVFIWRARKVLFAKGAGMKGMRGFVVALGVATVMVYLRTIFRLAETSQGVFGYLSTHEVFFGCLEFAPVVVAVWVFNVWHPGRCVKRVSTA